MIVFLSSVMKHHLNTAQFHNVMILNEMYITYFDFMLFAKSNKIHSISCVTESPFVPKMRHHFVQSFFVNIIHLTYPSPKILK